jgi:hypothetical protein
MNTSVATQQSEPMVMGAIQHWYDNTIFIIFTDIYIYIYKEREREREETNQSEQGKVNKNEK